MTVHTCKTIDQSLHASNLCRRPCKHMMLLTMGQFRHWLLAEVNSTMVSRLVSLEVFVTGPSYEGQRFVAALSTEALKRGEVKVLGTTTIVPMMSTGLENGAVVKPWMVDSFAADTPSVSVALMGVTLALCHAVVPSRNVSPAAKNSSHRTMKGSRATNRCVHVSFQQVEVSSFIKAG